MSSNRPLSRRGWLVSSAIAAGSWVSSSRGQPNKPRSANEAVRFACIGVGGRGGANLATAARYGDIVALCDVDEQSLGKAAETYSAARRSFDFRKTLEEQAGQVDAVVISTPDHSHAAMALMAMRLGKHVYCEKALCRYLYEARQLADVARSSNVVTQLGNQATAMFPFRRGVERIRQGVIGTIREVHIWTNRPVWPTGPEPRITGRPPASLHWDEFVGPAEMTEYSPDYHPFKWRAFWRFGNGALGDMASHIMNAPYHACDLRNPVTVEAQHSGHNQISFPKSSLIRWDFASTAKRGPLSMFWYDGGRKPDASLFGQIPIASGGCLLVGSEGTMISASDYNDKWQRIPKESTDSLQSPVDLLPTTTDHFAEFVDAIRGRGECMSNFADVSGPFTETILLGNLALWAGGKITWDAANLKAKGATNLDAAIRPVYRKGYDL